jgi:chromate transporter
LNPHVPLQPAGTGAAPPRPGSPRELFVAFTLLALQGFGGVLVVAQRVLCEDRRWLSRAEFVELLSIGQVLPGPNVCNVALMLGDRFFGWRGAVAALGGLLTVPFGIVLALVAAYAHWAGNPAVAGALRGMGAVSAGLIAGTALKLAQSLRANPLGAPACVGLAGAAFALVGLLRIPLAWALLAIAPAAWGLAWRRVGGGGRR